MQMSKRTTVVFAPHPDDEVLGVGGTIIKKVKNGEKVIICIATASADMKRRMLETYKASGIMGVENVIFLNKPDLALDRIPHEELTDAIREVLERFQPNEVYTPHPGDLHTDHKALTAAVMVAIRPKYSFAPEVAYAYETMSETGLDFMNPLNSFEPNVYENISDILDLKLKALSMHESQIEIYPCSRSVESIRSLAIYRGTQANMESAEAFSLIRRYSK